MLQGATGRQTGRRADLGALVRLAGTPRAHPAVARCGRSHGGRGNRTLIVWGTLFCLGVVGGIGSVDSDFDQEIGWAFVLPGLIAFPVFVISLVAETWARRKRRWRVELEGSKVVFVRRPGDDSG